MVRIGITQRVEERIGGGERRDCLDQAWTALLADLGMLAVPIPNRLPDVRTLVTELQFDGLILSGGNDLAVLQGATNVAPERDASERALLELSAESGLPLFGVCRGLQIMARYHGATLTRVEGHVATRHPVHACGDNRLVGEDRQSVNSFHQWALRAKDLPSALMPAAMGMDDTVEAIQHVCLRQAAVMWHPERGAPDDRDARLIRTFFGSAP